MNNPDPQTSTLPHFNRTYFGLFLGSGLVILLLTALKIFPWAFLMAALSSDGSLSNEMRIQLISSQSLTGIFLLLAAPAAGFSSVLSKLLINYLQNLGRWTFSIAAAILAAILTYFVQGALFDHIPHVTDATSHLFQAKIFSLGQLYMPVPACFEHFFQYNIFMTTDNRWFTAYPPGHALTLAAFMTTVGVTFYGPLMQLLSTLAFSRLAFRFFGRHTAILATFLFVTSPLLLILGGSYMSHVSLLTYSLVGLAAWAWGLDAEKKTQRVMGLLAAGFCLAMTGLTRPQDTVLLGGAIFFTYLVAIPKSETPRLLKSLPLFIAGAILPVAIQLFWNKTFFGSPLSLGYGRSPVQSLTPLLVPKFGFTEAFGIKEALSLFGLSMFRLDRALFGWSVSFIFLPFTLLTIKQRSRDLACWGGIGMVLLLYFFYAYYGLEYEARFYAATIPYFCILTASGAKTAARLIGNAPGARGLIAMIILLMTLHSIPTYWKNHIVPNYANDFEEVSTVVRDTVEHENIDNAIVMIRANVDGELFRYSSGFIYNDPELNNSVIYARDLPGKEACLKEGFPNRKLYRFQPNADWSAGTLLLLTN